MAGTHARFAPSGLARLMVCPGSHGLEQGFPEDEEGEAAKEGTAAHEVMAALVQLDYLPPVGSLGDFPLIAWAKGGGPSSTSGGDTGGKVQDAMQRLASSGVVAPSIGDYWLAAGIRFSSFQLIDSFALSRWAVALRRDICLRD